MAYNKVEDIIIENATISGRNFSGKKFGDGKRSFGVIIEDPEDAQKLIDIGWNVKAKEGYNPGDPERYILNVAVRFDRVPPEINCITGNRRHRWGESQIGALDNARIKNVDITITPSHYNKNGHEGIKAYLSEMWVTIEQSALAEKYSYLEDDEDDCPFD